MNIHQATSLDVVGSALDTLRARYSRRPDLETRREELKQFVTLVMTGVQQLISEENELCDGTYPSIKPILEEIDAAFLDAIEAEEEREARTAIIRRAQITRQYGTYHTRGGHAS